MAPRITFTVAGVDGTIVSLESWPAGDEEQRDGGYPQETAPLGPPRGAGRGRRAHDGRRGVLAWRVRLGGVAAGRLGLRPVRSPVLGPEAARGRDHRGPPGGPPDPVVGPAALAGGRGDPRPDRGHPRRPARGHPRAAAAATRDRRGRLPEVPGGPDLRERLPAARPG